MYRALIGGGVLFWILYHSSYASLDTFGGGYGNYPYLPAGRAWQILPHEGHGGSLKPPQTR